MSTLEQSVELLSMLTGIEDLKPATPLGEIDSLTVVEWMFAIEDELGLDVDMERADSLGPDDTVESAVRAIVVS